MEAHSVEAHSVCKICFSNDDTALLVSACECRGSMAYHEKCLKWYLMSLPQQSLNATLSEKVCPECLTPFTFILYKNQTIFYKIITFLRYQFEFYNTMVFIIPLLYMFSDVFKKLFTEKFDMYSLLLFLIFTTTTNVLFMKKYNEQNIELIFLFINNIYTILRSYFTEVDGFAFGLLLIFNLFSIFNFYILTYNKNERNFILKKTV